MPSIFEKLNSDQKLALLAAINPVMLLEELGYQFTAESRSHLENILRFSKEKAAQIESLESKIYKIAGKRFNINSPEELDNVLFNELRLKRVELKPQAGEKAAELATSPLPIQFGKKKENKDPLEELKDAHPLMEPLLAYRQVEATACRFARPELYEKIKRGEAQMPFAKITFHPPSQKSAKGSG